MDIEYRKNAEKLWKIKVSFSSSVDSLDWKDYGADSIVKTVCNHKNLCNGSIILLHNGAKYTPEALEAVITGLQAQGYELVPISQLICTGEYTIDHTGRQIPQ